MMVPPILARKQSSRREDSCNDTGNSRGTFAYQFRRRRQTAMRKLEIIEPLVPDIDDAPNEDVDRLLSILSARGYEASRYQATRLWHLPHNDDAVWHCIKGYFVNRMMLSSDAAMSGSHFL